MDAHDQLKGYLSIARDILLLGGSIVSEIKQAKLSRRDRGLIGLGLKMYRTFECLVEDAERGRSEALHHLKTLVETWIYFNWARQDAGDKRIALLMAYACSNRERYFRLNQDEEIHPEYYEGLIRDYVKGIEPEWEVFKRHKIETLAAEAGVSEWYGRVYRRACEPAHITDWGEHIPQLGEALTTQQQIGPLYADVALNYALDPMIWLLEAGTEYCKTERKTELQALKDRRKMFRDNAQVIQPTTEPTHE